MFRETRRALVSLVLGNGLVLTLNCIKYFVFICFEKYSFCKQAWTDLRNQVSIGSDKAKHEVNSHFDCVRKVFHGMT